MFLMKTIAPSPLVSGVLLAECLLAAGPFAALAADNPILRMEGQSEMEIDLGMVVDDFLPLVLGFQKGGEEGWAAQLYAFVDLTGIRALDRMIVRSSVTNRTVESRITISLDPGVKGFLPELAAVPSGRFRFGRYLDPEGTLAVVSFQNFCEGFKTLAGLGAATEVVKSGFVRSPEGDITMAGFNLSRDLFPRLRGELDVILFPLDPGPVRSS
jgi:hypothetical protein